MADPLEALLSRLAVRAGVDLSPFQSSQLVSYLTALSSWNTKINLTSLDLRGFPESSLLRLVVEPLQTAKLVPTTSFCWFDLGSGGGSPAIPLRVVAPQGSLTMVESRGRKAAFLREACRVCGLEGTSVITSRIEELPRDVEAGSVELFTMRAVRLSNTVAETMAKLGTPDVRIILFGPVDWSAMQPEFAAVATNQEMTVLARTDVPRGTLTP